MGRGGEGGGEGIERSGISYFTRVVEIFPIQNSNSSNEFDVVLNESKLKR